MTIYINSAIIQLKEVIIINLIELYHQNCVKVFNAISNGCDNAVNLAKNTKLASGTINQILNELLDKGLISVESVPSKRCPYLKYTLNKDNFVMLIEKIDNDYFFTSMNPLGDFVGSFKVPVEYKYLNPTYSLEYVVQLKKIRNELVNCKGIYILDSNLENVKIINPDIKLIDIHQLIIEYFSNDTEINFIEYLDKKTLLVYSHIHNVTASYEDVSKIFNIDNHIVYNEERKYDYIFNALRVVALKAVKNQIYEIKKRFKTK